MKRSSKNPAKLTFKDWYDNFTSTKKEVPSNDQSDDYAIHSIRRYVGEEQLWEIAFTYTGRLVMRCGPIEPGGIKIKWGEWETLHHVILPK